jgi:hypothetical protein
MPLTGIRPQLSGSILTELPKPCLCVAGKAKCKRKKGCCYKQTRNYMVSTVYAPGLEKLFYIIHSSMRCGLSQSSINYQIKPPSSMW